MENTVTGSGALEIYEGWLDALNARDWGRFAEFLAPAAEFVFTHRLPSEEATLRGRADIVRSFTGWQSRFARLPGEITDAIGESDRCAVQLWWEGATVDGAEVGFASCHLVTARDGKLTEIVDFFDQKTYDEQIGR